MNEKKWRRILRESRGFLIFLVGLFMFRTAVADWMVVPSGSMNPTLMEGDYVLVQKTRYGIPLPFTDIHLTDGRDPRRGEIAVFHSPTDGTRLIKRVIGVPGDTVSMHDERLSINGEPVGYERVGADFKDVMLDRWQASEHVVEREKLDGQDHYMMVQRGTSARRNFAEVVVPEGEYLMLGDNRDNSADSRYIGLVPRRLFVGRATRVLASFNPDDYLLPRFDRTLAPLR